ncbi:MAG: hypothetical protein WCH74_11445 [Chloroflexota bacterium]
MLEPETLGGTCRLALDPSLVASDPTGGRLRGVVAGGSLFVMSERTHTIVKMALPSPAAPCPTSPPDAAGERP